MNKKIDKKLNKMKFPKGKTGEMGNQDPDFM